MFVIVIGWLINFMTLSVDRLSGKSYAPTIWIQIQFSQLQITQNCTGDRDWRRNRWLIDFLMKIIDDRTCVTYAHAHGNCGCSRGVRWIGDTRIAISASCILERENIARVWLNVTLSHSMECAVNDLDVWSTLTIIVWPEPFNACAKEEIQIYSVSVLQAPYIHFFVGRYLLASVAPVVGVDVCVSKTSHQIVTWENRRQK